MTEQEIFEAFVPLVREVTGARVENVTMGSNLMIDLGAESIDLLDLSFLIEDKFGVGLEADEFERQATARMGGAPYERDGRLTNEALDELKKALPEVPPERLRAGLRRGDLPSVLNVGVFVHLIERKLAAKQAAVPSRS